MIAQREKTAWHTGIKWSHFANEPNGHKMDRASIYQMSLLYCIVYWIINANKFQITTQFSSSYKKKKPCRFTSIAEQFNVPASICMRPEEWNLICKRQPINLSNYEVRPKENINIINMDYGVRSACIDANVAPRAMLIVWSIKHNWPEWRYIVSPEVNYMIAIPPKVNQQQNWTFKCEHTKWLVVIWIPIRSFEHTNKCESIEIYSRFIYYHVNRSGTCVKFHATGNCSLSYHRLHRQTISKRHFVEFDEEVKVVFAREFEARDFQHGGTITL